MIGELLEVRLLRDVVEFAMVWRSQVHGLARKLLRNVLCVTVGIYLRLPRRRQLKRVIGQFMLLYNNKTLFRHHQIRDVCPVHGCVCTYM